MQLPHTTLSRAIDEAIRKFSYLLSWIWLLLVGIIVLNVILRYAFGEGRVEFEEIQWHLYSIGFLFGLSYAYVDDAHIRVDVVHSKLDIRTQAWLELYGTLFLLLPFIALILVFGVPFVLASFALNETSQAPGGLAFRWLIKAALPLGFLILLAAVVARLSRVFNFLFKAIDTHGS